MKNNLFLLVLIVLIACNTNDNRNNINNNVASIAPINNEVLESAVIYEANIRQYSPEGTFNKFTEDIPKLKELGIKIIWLMPIYPISTTKSKGSLGSYYAVSDYTKVNPEFGNLDDVKKLVNTAHENGMYVILDWVANHTGWDHIWLKEHPDFYTKNENGEITHTVDTDWYDVADLNYDNHEMRVKMEEALQYWIKEVNIDGYRCDVAGMVPVEFWKPTIAKLRELKPIFMLAEAWEPELLKNGFDMAYGWDTHHVLNHIAKGEKAVKAWDERMIQIDTLYQKDDILMNFVTNHDENSWNGTVKERMGAASEAMLALTYVAPGMPLIYSGQEYDMDKRLRFFEKDTIIKTKGKVWPVLEKLGKLKSSNKALNGGKNAASYTRIKSSNDQKILIFTREKEGVAVTFMANLSETGTIFTSEIEGSFQDYMANKIIHFSKDDKIGLKPWEYKILLH